MVRDRKMRNINCPHCGKPMKKHRKKREYLCINPRCPVIFVRIHHGTKHVGREPRFKDVHDRLWSLRGMKKGVEREEERNWLRGRKT